MVKFDTFSRIKLGGKMEKDYLEIQGIKIVEGKNGITKESLEFAKKNVRLLGKLRTFIYDNNEGKTHIIGTSEKLS